MGKEYKWVKRPESAMNKGAMIVAGIFVLVVVGLAIYLAIKYTNAV